MDDVTMLFNSMKAGPLVEELSNFDIQYRKEEALKW